MSEQFGRYTLMERLGYGGMAEVFLARTNSVAGFEKLLAVKRLLPHCVEDKQTVDLLADEARITVQLTHPNIVQVFDFGRVDDSYYIAMEYVDGLDLKTLIQIDEDHSHPMPVDVALHVVISALNGLDFAHSRADSAGQPLGIIHRDVSPHNLLISRHGQVKLTDFGVARARISSHVSIVGDIRGKFSYMPPEQACGGEIDHRVDIFAAGVILYELLSGEVPFRSMSTGEQMKALTSSIAPPSSLVPEVPASLDEITLRALHNDPEQRIASARDFSDELREQLQLHFGGESALTMTTLGEMVDRRFRETEEQRRIDENSQMMALVDFEARDSLIGAPREAGVVQPARARGIADQPAAVHGELDAAPRAPQEVRTDEASVAFGDALIDEAARADGDPGWQHEGPRRPANGPLAYAETAIAFAPQQALDSLRTDTTEDALEPVDTETGDEQMRGDPTQLHRNPLDDLYADHYNPPPEFGEDGPASHLDYGEANPHFNEDGNDPEAKTAVHVMPPGPDGRRKAAEYETDGFEEEASLGRYALGRVEAESALSDAESALPDTMPAQAPPAYLTEEEDDGETEAFDQLLEEEEAAYLRPDEPRSRSWLPFVGLFVAAVIGILIAVMVAMWD